MVAVLAQERTEPILAWGLEVVQVLRKTSLAEVQDFSRETTAGHDVGFGKPLGNFQASISDTCVEGVGSKDLVVEPVPMCGFMQ